MPWSEPVDQRRRFVDDVMAGYFHERQAKPEPALAAIEGGSA
jgi:hypothetical protein